MMTIQKTDSDGDDVIKLKAIIIAQQSTAYNNAAKEIKPNTREAVIVKMHLLRL